MNKEKQNKQNRILFLSLLSVQRSLSIKYNECSMKCADEPLREDILNILRENHAMYHTLFDESRSRGWETESAAESDEVSAAALPFLRQHPQHLALSVRIPPFLVNLLSS